MSNSAKVVVAFAAGVALGAIAGILFAPDKGKETRKKISDAGKKTLEAIGDNIKKGKEKVETVKERMEEFVQI